MFQGRVPCDTSLFLVGRRARNTKRSRSRAREPSVPLRSRACEKTFTPGKTTPSRSDHLGSVPRLEPTDRRVIDGVAQCDLAQRLAGCHTLQGFARLMLGQLRL